jgi:hypothetical protein
MSLLRFLPQLGGAAPANFASASVVSFNSASAVKRAGEGTMASSDETDNRARKVAAVLRPLGRGPLTRVQAKRAGQLLDVHWTTVYRLRQRFLADPVISALDPQHRGPTPGGRRLSPAVDNIIQEVVQSWLPAQRQLAHPASDLVLEIRRRCVAARLEPPSRSTVARRWPEHREQDALRRAAVFAVPCGVMRRAGQKEVPTCPQDHCGSGCVSPSPPSCGNGCLFRSD